MGVRPPPAETDDEPDVITFGIAALDGRLDDIDVTFPVKRAELVRVIGQEEIPYDAAGNSMALQDALERTNTVEFDSRQELLNELHPVFEQRRAHSSSGFLAQLRAFLPF